MTAITPATTNVRVTPDAFMEEMTKLVRSGRAEAAAAHFVRHGRAVLDALSEPQRTLLDALMEYVDTVIDLEHSAGSRGERPRTPGVPKRSRSAVRQDVSALQGNP